MTARHRRCRPSTPPSPRPRRARPTRRSSASRRSPRRPTASPPARSRGARRRARSTRCAARYAAAGYGHGHRVGLMLENRPAFLFHWFALNALGASVVPINAEMRSAELEYLVGHSDIGLAVVLPGRGADLHAAAKACGVPLAVREWREDDEARDRGAASAAGRAAPGPARRCADRHRHRVRAALHLGHDRPAEGLHPEQRVLPERRRAGMPTSATSAACGRDHERIITPLPLNHVNAMCFSLMVDPGRRRLPDPARPLPSADLVAERARQPRDDHPLPRRDAGDADRRRPVARRPRACGALGLRRRRRRQEPCAVRGALRLPADRGLGDDRDRCRRRDHGDARAAPHRHPLLRPHRAVRRSAASSTTRAATSRPRRPASCWCAPPAPDPRRHFFSRLPEGRGGDRGGVGRRLVPHRRRRPARRRRQLLLRRPQEERDPAQRREHLGGRGRERAEPASGGEGVGGRGGARRPARRRGAGLHRHARAGRRRRSVRSSPPRSSTTRSASSPTSRHPAMWPSSTRCR